MTKDQLAPAQESKLSEVLALNGRTHLDNVNAAAQALSAEANQIGMTGTWGAAQRVAIVAGSGLLETPKGVVESIKKQGALGLTTTLAESAAVGYGLKALMSASAPVGKIAALALGASFVAQSVPEYYDAFNKGLGAHSWKEMDDASAKFGQATGGLAVDTVLGYGGFKIGAGAHALKTGGFDALRGAKPAVAEVVAPAEAAAHTDATALTEVARASDAPVKKLTLSPEHTISMKELYETDRAKFEEVLDTYYTKLEKAFPDASEIESKDVYRDYLKDKDFPWDMLVLRDKAGTVLGGIQSQVVDVNGSEIKKAVWAEHIWLDPEARTYQNFNTLLKTAKSTWAKTGSDIVFMEFNDRAKMTWEEQVADASAGLTPEARERIWGRVGLYVLGDESRRLAPYAQPAMGDGAPVTYLSMGIGPLKSAHLDGQSMPISDYLKLMRAAHETIPDINLATDPTVVQYTAELKALTDSGQDRLSYARLRDTQVARTILGRFIAKGEQVPATDKP
ncbi:MAG: hypothetical protein JSS83_14795 [Cyanobacteria bacterium SZAS LIN-3]|nr:hypothetical protein [Cyanobacteria bacterium SZAS LIN-3]